ncbi:LysR family transcriptional regulator ArgP [Albirhodobacter sp. R86504]|uniref:LysR family transcriptional regulator ArgP n=1 Tax=Albirhodobacter sp. R86504 TaxID=3093848 RepID=UPI003670B970
MLDYPALLALAEVLRTGSFEQAARALNVTPSAISQRIKALEDRTGAPLVLRGTPCTGTQTGRRLALHAEQVRLLEQGLDLAGERTTTLTRPPVIRIAVNADSLASWLIPALAEVKGVLFDLVIDDQDHCDEWLTRGEVWAAITANPAAQTGCDSLPLGALRYIATAAPAFIAEHFAQGVTAEALARAPSLVFNAKDRLQAQWAKMETGVSAPLPAHILPSPQAFLDAARAGLGWGMNIETMAREDLAAQRLVSLSPRHLDVALHWKVLRAMKGPLTPLTAAVRSAAARVLI